MFVILYVMKISLLDRSLFIQRFRNQLLSRGLLEIDPPQMMSQAGYDPQIRSIKAKGVKFETYLHNSPELFLKYLITHDQTASERGVFSLSHVFRDDPKTNFHRREFMMAEWYRPHFNLEQLQHDTIQLIYSLTHFKSYSYLDLTKEFAFNYNDHDTLESFLKSHIRLPPDTTFEDLFSLFWLHFVEEKIQNNLWIISGFPSKLKSMSKIQSINQNICERFEICINGVEIANAYEEENDSRILPNSHFLKGSLESLNLCSGIALGVERLLAFSRGYTHIEDVMFPEL